MTGGFGGRPFRLDAVSQSAPASTCSRTAWISSSVAATAPAVTDAGGVVASLAVVAEASSA
eukprot:5440793-Amphidinium_carterae.1